MALHLYSYMDCWPYICNVPWIVTSPPLSYSSHDNVSRVRAPATLFRVAIQGDSVVRDEFKEFCAETAMDIISIECAPEACTLFKGKPRVRGLPAGSRTKSTSAFGEFPPLRGSAGGGGSGGGAGSLSKHSRQHRHNL